MIELMCPSPADTMAAASRLAPLLRPGDIVVLSGELGSGKTLFTTGLAAGLGVEEPVTSPSFVLLHEYRSGFLPLFHADVYRLGTLNEFDDLDIVTQAEEGVLVIEWGNAVLAGLPPDHLLVEFEVQEDGTRVIRMVPMGEWVSRHLVEVL